MNWALLILLGILVALATIELYVILIRRVGEVFSEVETVKSFSTHHRIRLEVVFIVAMIAVGRHTILIDYEAVSGTYLLGLGGLALSLGVGYWLVGRSHGRIGGAIPAEAGAEGD